MPSQMKCKTRLFTSTGGENKRLYSLLHIALMVFTCAFMTGCVGGVNAQSEEKSMNTFEPQETIFGFEYLHDKLRFIVKSNGCTKAENFSVIWKSGVVDSQQITLVRNKPDMCRAKPRLVPVELELDKPKGTVSTVNITNPFGDKRLYGRK